MPSRGLIRSLATTLRLLLSLIAVYDTTNERHVSHSSSLRLNLGPSPYACHYNQIPTVAPWVSSRSACCQFRLLAANVFVCSYLKVYVLPNKA